MVCIKTCIPPLGIVMKPDPISMIGLILGALDKGPEAVRKFEQAAEDGSDYGVVILAYMYEHGIAPVEKDVERAMALYQRALGGGAGKFAAAGLANLQGDQRKD